MFHHSPLCDRFLIAHSWSSKPISTLCATRGLHIQFALGYCLSAQVGSPQAAGGHLFLPKLHRRVATVEPRLLAPRQTGPAISKGVGSKENST